MTRFQFIVRDVFTIPARVTRAEYQLVPEADDFHGSRLQCRFTSLNFLKFDQYPSECIDPHLQQGPGVKFAGEEVSYKVPSSHTPWLAIPRVAFLIIVQGVTDNPK